MPDIKDSVGEGGANKSHDVALVQAMLRVVKDAKSAPYLATDYDGSYGGATKAAIARFQIDQKLAVDPAAAKVAAKAAAPGASAPVPVPAAAGAQAVGNEKLGFVGANSQTLQKLSAMLPATHQDMRAIEGSKLVYIAADPAGVNNSKAAISNDNEYEAMFRAKLANLVQVMYETHKITLWVTSDGRRRTFSEQSGLFAKGSNTTKAGPGESNHNFGRAADIGMRGFKWVQGNGTIKTDNDWLSSLNAAKAGEATGLWKLRDQLATTQGLHPLTFEQIHLQSFINSQVNSGRSLAQLLTNVSKNNIQWKTGYQADFQSQGKHWAQVGSAQDVWLGNAKVSKADLAKARTAITGKAVKEADIKQADVDSMRAALKEDFQAAEDNWAKWQPVP